MEKKPSLNGEFPMVRISFWKNRFAIEPPVVKELSLDSLEISLKSPPCVRDKLQGPLLKLAEFGEKTRTTAKGNKQYRHDDNVVRVTGIEADLDRGVMSFERAVKILEKAKIHALVLTSPSYTPEFPKLRVLCPLKTPCAPEDRVVYASWLNGLLRGEMSPESFVLSQSYYYHRLQDNADNYRVQLIRGEGLRCIDEAQDLAKKAKLPKEDASVKQKPVKSKMDDVLLACQERGLNPRELKEGMWRIDCPWADEHSTPVQNDQETKYMLPYFSGYKYAAFKCHHGTCKGRTIRDLRIFLGLEKENPFEAPEGEGEDGDEIDVLSGHELPEVFDRVVDRPDTKQLAGPVLWENTVSIFFSQAGVGKSLLAMQIADGIARGDKDFFLPCEAEPQKVALFDFELSEQILKSRYVDKETGERWEASANIYRYDQDDYLKFYEDRRHDDRDSGVMAFVNHVIRNGKFKVAIIDNITWMISRGQHLSKSEDAGAMIHDLNLMAKTNGCSILAITHTPKPPNKSKQHPLSLYDMSGASDLQNFVPGVAALGRVPGKNSEVYLKLLKTRYEPKEGQIQYTTVMRLAKKNYGAMSGFDSLGLDEEENILMVGAFSSLGKRDKKKVETEYAAKQFIGKYPEMSLRELADISGIGKDIFARVKKELSLKETEGDSLSDEIKADKEGI